MEIHHDGDLPARSGMGSSSAFTVGLLHALHALEGRMVSKRQLAAEGIHVEQELLGETVGSQDQVATAYGGLNHIRFLPSGEISVRPIIMSADRVSELNSSLMLFYTGIKRTASGVASTYVEDIEDRRRSMRILQDLVEEGLAVLSTGADLRYFGELLHEAWLVKRDLSGRVSNDRVDGIYADALAAGAVGGKLLGAGGGGFMLLFVPPERREAVAAEVQPADPRAVQVRVAGQPGRVVRAGSRLLQRGHRAAGFSGGEVPGALRRSRLLCRVKTAIHVPGRLGCSATQKLHVPGNSRAEGAVGAAGDAPRFTISPRKPASPRRSPMSRSSPPCITAGS